MAKKFDEMFTEEERYDLQQKQELNEIDLKAVAGGVANVAKAAVKGAATAVANKALGAVGLPDIASIKGMFDAGAKQKVAAETQMDVALAGDGGANNATLQAIKKQTKAQLGKDIDALVKQYTQMAVKAYNDDKAKKIKGFFLPGAAKGKKGPAVPPEVWITTVIENASKSLFDTYKAKYVKAPSALTPAMIQAKFPPEQPAAAPAAPGAKPAAPGAAPAPAAAKPGAAPAAAAPAKA
jgi:hypothetical protein